MRKVLFVTMALCLLLCACNEDEKEQDNTRPYDDYADMNPPHKGMMMDAACITGMNLYCLEKIYSPAVMDISAVYYWNYTYKQIEPVFADYTSVKIYIVFDKNGNGFANDTTQVAKTINDLVYDWYCQRTDFIIEQYYQSTQRVWPFFFTSYVNGDVKLTCDKVLFGQQPGVNLSSHFKVTPAYCFLPVGRKQPQIQYNFEDENQLWSGVPMTDFFQKDSWMQYSYLLGFMDEPAEQYDELTFTLTFPASLEHVRDFVTSAYNGENAPMKVTDTTYTASFTAKFDWE